MKLQRLIFTTLFLIITFQFCFAQEAIKAILLDETGRTSCADLQVRVDASLNEALKDSNSSAYVIVYGKKNDLFENLRFESWVRGIIELRRDGNRTKIIRGEQRDNFTVQVWKVPINSSLDFFSEAEWSYLFPKSTKAFFYTSTYPDGGICPMTSHVKLFADLLIDNPTARGHLVIYDKTNKNFRNQEKEVLAELVNQYKVPRHRLKVFYVVDKDYPYKFSAVEFWIVPRKIKK